jgi:hypothetical protein
MSGQEKDLVWFLAAAFVGVAIGVLIAEIFF